MAIERTVETDVYCDVCGEWIMGWKSNDTGVSRAWAAEYTRRRGGTVGKKIVCKKCRIKERIRTCSLQRKIGNAGRDSDGTCMGFASVVSDEPMQKMHSLHILSMGRIVQRIEAETGRKPRPVTMAT